MKIRPVGSRVVPCGQTDRQTDITQLIVDFRNFANASKSEQSTSRPDQFTPGKEAPISIAQEAGCTPETVTKTEISVCCEQNPGLPYYSRSLYAY